MTPESPTIASVGINEVNRLPALIRTLRAKGGRIAICEEGEVIAVVALPALFAQFDRLSREGNEALARIGAVFADADPGELDRAALRAVAEVCAEARRGRTTG